MLDRARNTAGDIELRRNDLARLPYLELLVHPALLDRHARGSDRSTQLVCKWCEHIGEPFRAIHSTTTRNDELRIAQIHALGCHAQDIFHQLANIAEAFWRFTHDSRAV